MTRVAEGGCMLLCYYWRRWDTLAVSYCYIETLALPGWVRIPQDSSVNIRHLGRYGRDQGNVKISFMLSCIPFEAKVSQKKNHK